MKNLLKSTVLGIALLSEVAATGYAQSVSSLSPTSAATAPTGTAPAYASDKIYPSPGNGGQWQAEHRQVSQFDNDRANAPYSTKGAGPAPN